MLTSLDTLKNKVCFRKAVPDDLSEIEAVYEKARSFMREAGNPTQWGSVYPPTELIKSDIIKGFLYVGYDERIEAVFAYIPENDPTYDYIEGAWLDDSPYSAVHRVASLGNKKGILKEIMDYCFIWCENIKIDTHEDNIPMQKALEKYGFQKCGTIYLENGEARLAYQMRRSKDHTV